MLCLYWLLCVSEEKSDRNEKGCALFPYSWMSFDARRNMLFANWIVGKSSLHAFFSIEIPCDANLYQKRRPCADNAPIQPVLTFFHASHVSLSQQTRLRREK